MWKALPPSHPQFSLYFSLCYYDKSHLLLQHQRLGNWFIKDIDKKNSNRRLRVSERERKCEWRGEWERKTLSEHDIIRQLRQTTTTTTSTLSLFLSLRLTMENKEKNTQRQRLSASPRRHFPIYRFQPLTDAQWSSHTHSVCVYCCVCETFMSANMQWCVHTYIYRSVGCVNESAKLVITMQINPFIYLSAVQQVFLKYKQNILNKNCFEYQTNK